MDAVIFAPGSFAIGGIYSWIGEALAERGYLTSIFTLGVYDIIPEWGVGFETALNHIQLHYDVGNVYAAGHSMGANGALIYMGENTDITAITAIAPGWCKRPELPNCDLMNTACDFVTRPVQFIVGEKDEITGFADTMHHYGKMKQRKQKKVELIAMPGANHVHYINGWIAWLYRIVMGDGRASVSIRKTHENTMIWMDDWMKRNR